MNIYKYFGKRLTSLILSAIIITTSTTYTGVRKLTKKELNNYQKYFKEFNLDSNWDKYDNIKDEVEKLIEESNLLASCPYIYDGDLDKLITTIKKNTQEYIKEHPELYSAFLTKQKNIEYNENYTKENLKRYQQVFEKAIYSALEKIISKSTNNINEDICKMQKLKIVFSDTEFGVLGIYEPKENLIIISATQILGTISIFQILEPDQELLEEQQKLIEEVLIHELTHLRQHSCEHRTTKSGSSLILNYSNPYVSTILESSAESIKYNTGLDEDYLSKETYDYTYPIERSQEGLLFLLNLFTNKEINEYYNSILDTDIEKFCEFFDAQTEEEIYELYQIIYHIDAYNTRVPTLPIDKKEKAQQELKNLYKLEIYKKVLSNMVTYTNTNQTLSLEENLIILNLIKDIILNNEYENPKYLQLILEEEFSSVLSSILEYEFNFSTLTNKYEEFLCTYYGINYQILEKIQEKVTNITSGLNNTLSEDQEKLSKVIEKYPILKYVLFTSSNYIDKTLKETLKQAYPNLQKIPQIIREINRIELEPKKLRKTKPIYVKYHKTQTRIIN